jgi:membrane-bound lytic murein transglycosylase D
MLSSFLPVLSLLLLASVARAAIPPIEIPDIDLPTARPRTLRISIPLEMNPRISRWVRYFTQEDSERFGRFMSRGAYYKVLIQDLLVKGGVPPEFFYLAMIESGFTLHAHSAANAVGIWQFIPSTARMYGLRVDRHVDERLDVIRSTQAAARLLKNLHSRFGSWYLAMAAYNAGDARILRAIRRGRTRDFWRLAASGLLPRETANYVPQFQAAMRVARAPAHYGFTPSPSLQYPKVRRVRLTSRDELDKLKGAAGIPYPLLRWLNPHLLAEHADRKNYPGARSAWLPVPSKS